MGSNPTQSMDVCVSGYSVYVVLCALCRADQSPNESYRLSNKRLGNWRRDLVQQKAAEPLIYEWMRMKLSPKVDNLLRKLAQAIRLLTCTRDVPLSNPDQLHCQVFVGVWGWSALLPRRNRAVADLHTLQFTVTHALGFSIFTSRVLVTDFNAVLIPVSHMKPTLHNLIPFLLLFCKLRNSTQL
jgi:hypothetical protein